MMHSDISKPIDPLLMAYWSFEQNANGKRDPRLQEIQRALNKEIENWLLEEKQVMEKRRKGIKILLLGQSESGKSSVLKNFQLAFIPWQFDKDRSAWRIIVHLNVIGSLKTIIDALDEEWGTQSVPENEDDAQSSLQSLRLALQPLFHIESNLLELLSPHLDDCRGMTIRAGYDWKAMLYSKAGVSTGSQVFSEEYDPAPLLEAQRHQIIMLWRNPRVQEILTKRCSSLRRSPGFFMDDIERVARPGFLPTNSDIIRARLRTVGIEEQHFEIQKRSGEGASTSNDFYIIDVAGARSQRHSWVPFFDDVQCILFLAPLSFNETLEEDRKVNKIEDSFLLWKAICRNELLANIQIILFLNKVDVLKATLAAGVKVNKYVPTYKDRPNEVESVTKYFKDRFQHFHKKYSPPSRAFKCYETSAIDIKSMQEVLFSIRDKMLREKLAHSHLL